jgi:hypothetical protein
VSGTGFVHAGVGIAGEQHSVQTMATAKMKKNRAKLKVMKK